QITITDDNISSFGNAGVHVSMSTWALRDVLWVRLIPPEEFGHPFGAIEFQTQRGGARIGVPASLSMRRIADVLHAQGISVVLPGWQPVEAGSGPISGDGNAAPASAPSPAAMPKTSARV